MQTSLMQRPQDSPRMRVTIEVLVDPERSDCIVANLAKLVRAVSIEARKPDAKLIRMPRWLSLKTP
jgi:hypothetical protein